MQNGAAILAIKVASDTGMFWLWSIDTSTDGRSASLGKSGCTVQRRSKRQRRTRFHSHSRHGGAQSYGTRSRCDAGDTISTTSTAATAASTTASAIQ